MKLSELMGQGITNKTCGSFADLLKNIREVDAEEERDERLAAEFAWEDYAERLTDAYIAGRDAEVARENIRLCAALDRLEREGVRDLRQSGLVKVRAGVTTLEEVIACTNE